MLLSHYHTRLISEIFSFIPGVYGMGKFESYGGGAITDGNPSCNPWLIDHIKTFTLYLDVIIRTPENMRYGEKPFLIEPPVDDKPGVYCEYAPALRYHFPNVPSAGYSSVEVLPINWPEVRPSTFYIHNTIKEVADFLCEDCWYDWTTKSLEKVRSREKELWRVYGERCNAYGVKSIHGITEKYKNYKEWLDFIARNPSVVFPAAFAPMPSGAAA